MFVVKYPNYNIIIMSKYSGLAWTVWRRTSRILSREGARPRVSVFLFKAVVQSVLLFGAETWVVSPRMGRLLGVFRYQVARQLTGRIPWRRLNINWGYNLVEAAR